MNPRNGIPVNELIIQISTLQPLEDTKIMTSSRFKTAEVG